MMEAAIINCGGRPSAVPEYFRTAIIAPVTLCSGNRGIALRATALN
jgi:hypothetical protein